MGKLTNQFHFAYQKAIEFLYHLRYQLLSENAGNEIYTLIEFLDALGYRIALYQINMKLHRII
ncbi:hypothetical protein FJR05_23650 [Dolichospermum sp. UHCC 0259]|nr:hypothetical protein [Dolichospermum sp. UHCC 0259]